MGDIYNSDKPISEEKQDRFNRSKFSKRIAETIIKRENSEGLVLGIYGVWGEGKTSVLNILETELNKDENIVTIKFNPWRYTTEDVLILNFLKKVSESIDKELNNTREKIGDFVSKYGSFISFFNLNAKEIGNSISDTDLESFKNRVNDFLKDSKKRVVIIIDDIDRLDKQELFSIFKLVKLTGDFYNTYYVLSFDDEMVASAIGERFANGDKSSGYNYLEKIIQVPIRIPKALSSTLLTYTFEQIDEVLKEAEISLSDNESRHIGTLISEYVLSRIKTPRLAVRFSNSLSFLLPLLKGEVNYSDLILFEAIKIFYPEHYDFVKNNSHFFIESYNFFGGSKNQEKATEIKSHLEKLGLNLAKKESKFIEKLLIELFPRLNEALHNSYVQDAENVWSREKKIGSAKYFNRYFLYSISDNEISDVCFDNFINSIESTSLDDLSNDLSEILKQVDSLEFLNKLSYYHDKIEWVTKKKLIELITINQDSFQEITGAFRFGMVNPKSSAAIMICNLLNSCPNTDEKISLAKELLSSKAPFIFSEEILKWLTIGDSEEETFSEKGVSKELREVLLNRAIKDAEEKKSTIFETFEGRVFRLLDCWYEKDSIELKEYAKNLIEENPTYVKTIIYSLTSLIYSSAKPNPYKIDFPQTTFELMEKYFDIELINTKLIECFDEEIKQEEVKFYDHDEGQNELNALRQFRFWYEKANSIEDLLGDS